MPQEAFYPPADRATQWFSTRTSPARTSNRLVLWHCTEMGVPGEPWPTYTYDGHPGGSAPHWTVKPDRANKRLLWRQHWRADESAKALAHPQGTPETNNSGVLQIELGGTSVEGDPGYPWYDPDDWALEGLADFARWAHDEWGIPLTDEGRRWVPLKRVGKYVQQTEASSRLTWAQWATARGHSGHEHAPGNDHVDPGPLPVRRMLEIANGQEPDVPLTPAEIAAIADASARAIHNQQIYRNTWTGADKQEHPLLFADAILAAYRKAFPTADQVAAAVKAALTSIPAGTATVDDATIAKLAAKVADELATRLGK